jgi:hypothetical protein
MVEARDAMVAREGSKGRSIRVIEGQDPGRGRERLGVVEMKLFPGGWGVEG